MRRTRSIPITPLPLAPPPTRLLSIVIHCVILRYFGWNRGWGRMGGISKYISSPWWYPTRMRGEGEIFHPSPTPPPLWNCTSYWNLSICEIYLGRKVQVGREVGLADSRYVPNRVIDRYYLLATGLSHLLWKPKFPLGQIASEFPFSISYWVFIINSAT